MPITFLGKNITKRIEEMLLFRISYIANVLPLMIESTQSIKTQNYDVVSCFVFSN